MDKKKQVKTYKDIVLGEESDGGYEIDLEKEEKLRRSKENLKTSTKVLLKILGAFFVFALLYFFVTRVIFEIKKDPVYFSNIFYEKLDADSRKVIKYENLMEDRIEYFQKIVGSSFKNRDRDLNVLFLSKKDINGEDVNMSSFEFLTKIKKYFVFGNPTYLKNDFVLASYNLWNKNNYFAFFDIKNFSLANKYMILWEKDLKKAEGQNVKGFISKTLNNVLSRILIDEADEIILGYAFIDQKTLVFFDNEEAFKDVIEKVTISK